MPFKDGKDLANGPKIILETPDLICAWGQGTHSPSLQNPRCKDAKETTDVPTPVAELG